MSWLQKVWGGLKRWGLLLFGLLATLMGAGWLWKRNKKRLQGVRDELALARATGERDKLKAVREEIVTRVGEKAEEIEHIDRQLEQNAKDIVAAHAGTENMTEEEMLDAFAGLGL